MIKGTFPMFCVMSNETVHNRFIIAFLIFFCDKGFMISSNHFSFEISVSVCTSNRMPLSAINDKFDEW